MAVLSKQQKITTVSIVIFLDDALKKRNSIKKKKSKRLWIRKLFKESKCSGFFHILTNKLEMFDRKYFILTFKNIPRPI